MFKKFHEKIGEITVSLFYFFGYFEYVTFTPLIGRQWIKKEKHVSNELKLLIHFSSADDWKNQKELCNLNVS